MDRTLKPSKTFMHPDKYRDLVVYGLCAEGWTQAEAEAEAGRRLEGMRKTPEEHLAEATEQLQGLSFEPRAQTFAGTLLRGAFDGTFPPFISRESQAEFYANEERPEPLRQAYKLGLSNRDGGLSSVEAAEWATLQESYP